MYWQVYLHKTVLSAEFMLVNVLRRARQLATSGVALFASPALRHFLYAEISREDFLRSKEALDLYASLDDFDITCALKVWQKHEDRVLSMLASKILNRELFKIEIRKEEIALETVDAKRKLIASTYDFTEEEASYFVIHSKVDNRAYNSQTGAIRIYMKNGSVEDAAYVSDHLNLAALNQVVEKHFMAYLK
jgi:HD superfamily phosphohydrolase